MVFFCKNTSLGVLYLNFLKNLLLIIFDVTVLKSTFGVQAY